VRLGPFDEVGDDQEVARELHLLDDAELEFQPLLILLAAVAFCYAQRRYAFRQAVAGLLAQFLAFRLCRIGALRGPPR
jgi:hypothetical protein